MSPEGKFLAWGVVVGIVFLIVAIITMRWQSNKKNDEDWGKFKK